MAVRSLIRSQIGNAEWYDNFLAGYSPSLPFLEYLVIAGGGGGASTNSTGSHCSAGAGAGGYRSSVEGESSGGGASAESPFEIGSDITLGTNYTVTVGAGGTGGAAGNINGTNGSNSVFATITSVGGGASNGENGGSGAGVSVSSENPAGSGTANQGFDGGDSNLGFIGGGSGSGGGGAGGEGQTQPSSSVAGDGGTGVSSAITGSAITRAVGGRGGQTDLVSSDGAANTGNGAEGQRNASPFTGLDGGSGVVILKYPSIYSITIGAGLTGSTATVGGNKVTTITAGTGNISFS